MKLFPQRYSPPGTAPGTLLALTPEVPVAIRLIDYTETEYLGNRVRSCIPAIFG